MALLNIHFHERSTDEKVVLQQGVVVKWQIQESSQKSKELHRFLAPSTAQVLITDFQHGSELFTELQLSEMKKIFEEDADTSGALKLSAFLKATEKVLSDVSGKVLEAIFLKVDTDCSGFITWQKYMDYLVREFQEREAIRKKQYRLRFYLPMRIIPLNQGCEIVKVEYVRHRLQKKGHFLTVTKTGMLQFWSETFSLLSSFKILRPHNQQMWVIDMVCLHNMDLIALSSADQKIEFFDISNHNCKRAFTFIDLDNCILVMDYWSDYQKAVFCCGDTKGNIFVFTSDNVTSGLFNPRLLPKTSKWDHWMAVSMQKLLREKSTSHRSYRLKAVHLNWCQQVKFIPQLNLVASCSAVDKASLVLSVLPSKTPDSLKSSVLNLRRGILCFDYFPDKNVLVTGGYDPFIRLWNPLFSSRPVWLMKGHQTSVTHVLVSSTNNSILMSVSKDKNIRVWDMQDYVCLQSFCGKLLGLGNCPITSICLYKGDTFICTTYSIGILSGYLESQGPKKGEKTTTHRSPLCAVLYSKIFRLVLSGSQKGMVNVWEVMTGKHLTNFAVTDASHVELTAMAMDESERCLLTGLLDGTVKMWNYNSGECLRTFPNSDEMEISGIVHMNQAFYVTGWSKRITHLRLHKTRPVFLCNHWHTYHTEDILSMAKYQGQFLGTSSYNGDILFWNVNWFKPILKLNASESPLPLQPKKVQETEISKPCMGEQKWAYKATPELIHMQTRTLGNATLRQSLASAPPMIRRWRERESIRQSFAQIIFLQTRPRLPNTAALLSSCIDGYIYAWSIHGNGGLLGKFPVDVQGQGNTVVGAMATDENDCILVTGDCNGCIKIWDIKDYCMPDDHKQPPVGGGKAFPGTENKFQSLIPKRFRASISELKYLKEKTVVDGQTIFLTPPKLLVTWKGHIESVVDILYVDSFQLVISAGLDQNVKAWKIYGEAVGTFGHSVWSRLKEVPLGDGSEPEETPISKDTTLKASQLEYQEDWDLAEALAYQRREQAVLMRFLCGKENSEAEAWSTLQKMTPTSPWSKDCSPEDIENSWQSWEAKDKQVSKVLGAAYKPKERARTPEFLFSNKHYTCLKHQSSPMIYQSLHFKELKPTEHPDFSWVFKMGDPPCPRATTAHYHLDKDPELQSSVSQRPWSASVAQPTASTLSQEHQPISRSLVTPVALTSTLKHYFEPPKASFHVRF
ncbi:EF-hand calcium-binding domain-containing protein 8 [Echinops telfairi]|uniref:WD repeat-containing protein on Y chromosome n=1 Tax=Echinops telfairi TaxID=9371 RepID=A0ABM1VLG6_ECHTE|nr:EF-hand calcium-binding domain-containing protein 8 [Echinops telfairi]